MICRWFFQSLGVLLWLALASGTRQAVAEEPAALFVQALREQKLFDLAFVYLDQMEQSPLASQSFKEVIPLERAETLIQSTAQSRDLKFWEERLGAAEKLLSDYGSSSPSAENALKAGESLANLRYRQARVYIMRSESDRVTAEEKQQSLDKARSLLSESLTSFADVREKLKTTIEQVTAAAAKDDPVAREKIEPLRKSFTQVRLRTPIARELLADTFPAGSAERKKALEEATKEYMDIWDKFSRYQAGIDGCLSAGRCLQKLDKPKEALQMLEELFSQNDTAAYRPIKQAAALIAVDCWKAQQPFPFEQVIAHLEPLISALSPDERREQDWLKLELELAVAYRAKAEDMQANKSGSPGDISRFNRSAAALLRLVSRNPSESREKARQLMGEWNLTVPDEVPTEKVIATFADAKQQAIDMAAEVEVQYTDLARMEGELGSAAEADKAALQVSVAELQSDLKQSVDGALNMLRQALMLADGETSREDLNRIRYLQSYFQFVLRNYYESGLIGEFLLHKYPNVEWSRQSGALAMNAYLRLYNQASDAEKNFGRLRLADVCQRIIARWPGTSEANNAASLMTKLALSDKDFELAQKYFNSIGSDSAAKSELSIQLGQRRWFDYRAEKAKLSAEELVTRKDELAVQLLAAKQALIDGLAGGSTENVSFESAFASLLLVNAYLESGEIPQAVEQLENARIAPLDLIKQKHPAIVEAPKAAAFVRETYRTAINVYLASLRSGHDSQAWIAKAQNILVALRHALESQVGVNVNDEMIAIYGLIATELRIQFEQMDDVKERQNMAKSLLTFLTPLEQSAEDARTLLWMGATLVDIANSVKAGDRDVEGKTLVDELSKMAIRSLDRAEKLGFPGDPQAGVKLLELGRLKAVALRGAGKFEESVKQFAAVLSTAPAVVSIQTDAARTLQMWGDATHSANPYLLAMAGTERQRNSQTNRMQNVIWGWYELVRKTRNKDEFKDDFYRALLHLNECRLEHGKIENSTKTIESALQELGNARSRDPELGGSVWKTKFDMLEQQIKQQLGK